MIIGEEFAWAHFPKTAGTTTRALFLSFDGLVKLEVSPQEGGGHTTFADQRERIAGKTLVMNFRRLPFWVLSYAHFLADQGRLDATADGGVGSLVETVTPDGKLDRFLGYGEFEVGRWLRAEHLEPDFLALVDDLTSVGWRRRRQIRRAPRLNRLDYSRELGRWFTPASLAALYERSPHWAGLETELYGELVTLGG